jgi:hypothetical protein
MITIMKKTKRMTTRKTKSLRLSENPTNVDFEDGITDVKPTPSDVRYWSKTGHGLNANACRFLTARRGRAPETARRQIQ